MATKSKAERATMRTQQSVPARPKRSESSKSASPPTKTEPEAKRVSSAKPSAAKPARTKGNDAGQGGVASRTRKAAADRDDVLARLRAACLALPETAEKEAWQTPTFRVRGKMFAMFADDHHGDGRIAVWCKAPVGVQEALVESDPEHFFRPPYVGPSGWIGVRLDRGLDWREVADILREGWRVAAPRKLAATLDDRA